ncbi:MAG: acetylornithine transaminase [Propionibacteriaceae bacterium]|jgi:acetylornithine aminotransferase|nr:acetylornithine transaminase [Propionibacteriaceae bacterium]
MSLLDEYTTTMMNTFGRPPLVFVRGEGVYLWDDNGKRYLDLLAGIACVGLGHANPVIADAIADQARTLGHVSNLFATPTQIELAERLSRLLGHQARVFFANSGAEANEAGFKLTRLTGRTKIVVAEGSFHGRTMGALALTSTKKYREPFEPLPGDVTWVAYGDVAALEECVDDHTAAILLEPIQGENGVIVPPDGYLRAARRIADDHDALLWFDEVQSGMGRTGAWFAHSREGVRPDIMTLAKALGNGFPIGATLATGKAASLFTPGSHGSTFGGNALACRVGLTVIDQLEPLLPQIAATGDWLADQLRALPGVVEVRGRGLFVGVQLARPVAAAMVEAGLKHGIVMNAPRPAVIRLVPPLIVTQDDLAPLLEVWGALWDEAGRG